MPDCARYGGPQALAPPVRTLNEIGEIGPVLRTVGAESVGVPKRRTFGAGLVRSRLFQRHPDLWLLGASHAVLAALAYPLVLADAPWSRM